MAANALGFRSVSALKAGYRGKRFSPTEVVREMLSRIARLNPTLMAWQTVDDAGARSAARASTARWARGRPMGPLDGVPVAIKDVTETRGLATLNGSLAVDAKGPWRTDAIVVERLRRAGAIIMGKTATPEFAWSGVTRSKLLGVTCNPWNSAWTSGGSSGGSAVAVAAGMVTIATGTDSGGSVRGPASFCGLVGFKPSFGRVPTWPASPMMTIEHVGPLARSVADAALTAQIMAGHDGRDGYALFEPAPNLLRGLHAGVGGLRLAYSPDLGFATVQPEIRAVVESSLRTWRQAGARIANVKLDLGDPSRFAQILWNPMATLLVEGLGERARRIGPALRTAARAGSRISAADWLRAEGERRDLTARLAAFHEKHDLLLCPTVCVAPFDANRDAPADWPGGKGGWMALTFPFNLTGQPAVSLPCGFTAAGQPVGLQIVGRRGADALVLRAARAFERAFRMGHRPPE